MPIMTVSYMKTGNIYVSKHIRLGELKCKDNSDTIKYCTETLELVEKLREITECTGVAINSGYRTIGYNKLIGGASNSTHCMGYALDCRFINSKYNMKQICCIAQDLGFKGIGYINEGGIHLDMYPSRIYRGDERKGYSNNIGGDFYSYFNIKKGFYGNQKENYKGTFPTLPKRGYFKDGDKGTQVKNLQKLLNWLNDCDLVVDGILGQKTTEQIKIFQTNFSLSVDGLFGNNSLLKAKEIRK